MEEVLKYINTFKIIPVIAIDRLENVLHLADALIEGKLPLVEVTYRTNIAAQAINKLRKERPEMITGAGTILTIDELHSAIDNGASFAVAPGLNKGIVEEAKKQNFPFFPGIMTPSDLESAMFLGIHICKFFPAEAAGGITYLKSLVAPYSHKNIRFIPTGGINAGNLRDYLTLKVVIAVGGTWIATKTEIEKGNWAGITENCIQANKILIQAAQY
jgi:2-dehydro-3-deoxyphosphogluconate aldolase/(4S)-4-hydroxy-2-oxoglutarate aldolase